MEVAQLAEALQFLMGVTGIFHCLNPSGYTVTLGSTWPLTEMSARDIITFMCQLSGYSGSLNHLGP